MPRPGRPDLRGWEWYYLFSQCHAERLVLPHQDCFGWSPDGEIPGHDRSVIGCDEHLGRQERRRKASLQGCPVGIWCLSWSPDGKHIAAGTDRGTVVIWEVESGTKVRSLMGCGAAVHSIDWSPDGLKLAAGEGEGTISRHGQSRRTTHPDSAGDRRVDDPDLGLARRKDALNAGRTCRTRERAGLAP